MKKRKPKKGGKAFLLKIIKTFLLIWLNRPVKDQGFTH